MSKLLKLRSRRRRPRRRLVGRLVQLRRRCQRDQAVIARLNRLLQAWRFGTCIDGAFSMREPPCTVRFENWTRSLLTSLSVYRSANIAMLILSDLVHP